MKKILYAALLILGLTLQSNAITQNPSVQLSRRQQIRKGVDAWPLILNPKNEAERKINQNLQDFNMKLSSSLRDCDSNYAQFMGNRPQPSQGEEGAKSWTQSVNVTMSGPAFLSLVATTGYYCGGAHPYGYTSVAVFDLKTGEPVDPRQWFQPSFQESLLEQKATTSGLENSVVVQGMLKAYRDATHHECDDTYQDDQSFLIWPDAEAGKVKILADRLPGCCEACGIEASLTPEQAMQLGFSEAFLEEISEAHRKHLHP